jgi:hypothetical protein
MYLTRIHVYFASVVTAKAMSGRVPLAIQSRVHTITMHRHGLVHLNITCPGSCIVNASDLEYFPGGTPLLFSLINAKAIEASYKKG